MNPTVGDVTRMMEAMAPTALSEKWDNSGLQIGKKDQPVQKVCVALDPSPEVIAEACSVKADLLITHHPLLFHPVKTLDFDTPAGALLEQAVKNDLAVYSAHTNLDSALDGINDILAQRLGLKKLRPLVPVKAPDLVKLAVFVPGEAEDRILKAIFETGFKTGAGQIGEYSCCTFRQTGVGTFRPEPGTRPYSGTVGEISHDKEVRIETVLPARSVAGVVEYIRRHHPYETMAYDIFPLVAGTSAEGLGRVGKLDPPLDLVALGQKIKKRLGLPWVRIAGSKEVMVETAAVCSGSGSGLMTAFFSSGAQAYITGDLRYHDAKDAQAAGLGLLDVGHFATEYLIVETLVQRLRKALSEVGATIHVDVCGRETDPFELL